ncbi:MAG: NAD(P)-binding domain-containing protein [Chromatiales bacterium]|nr:NAD(P)-binding domain-containing protein [Chromatiales bacterium]
MNTGRARHRACVIGAGPSGLTAAKNLLAAGITDLVVLEKSARVGGNWVFDPRPGHSSVYASTHLISSRRESQFTDFPMPREYPDYPSHALVLKYLEDYARAFDLHRHIRFETEVRTARPLDGGGWSLALNNGDCIECEHLLVANGHHWAPREPQYPGTFSGEWLHAHAFKDNTPFTGRRVLVIGGGNSGCDIAVDTARVSAFTAISLRRGYYFVPKFVGGLASDRLLTNIAWMPRAVRIALGRLMLRIFVGPARRYGMPEPDHRLFESHPIVNSELPYAIRHGDVAVRRDIERFEGNEAIFTDGRREVFDVVIAATGYHVRFPFLDRDITPWADRDLPLYLRVFDPNRADLYFIGLIQPNGCIWPLADLQSQLVAASITGRWQRPADIAGHVDAELAEVRARYAATPRHAIEVDVHDYAKHLRRELCKARPVSAV